MPVKKGVSSPWKRAPKPFKNKGGPQQKGGKQKGKKGFIVYNIPIQRSELEESKGSNGGVLVKAARRYFSPKQLREIEKSKNSGRKLKLPRAVYPPQLAPGISFPSLPLQRQEQYINALVKWYQKDGYPYYPNDPGTRSVDLVCLASFDYTKAIDSKRKTFLRGTWSGNPICWSYMPHAAHVVCGRAPCAPADLVLKKNTKLLKTVLWNMMLMSTRPCVRPRVTNSLVRGCMARCAGMQAVGNFPPCTAAAIYHQFGAKNGVVWDMSGGWGGRMLGAWVARVKTYIATEPNRPTFSGLNQIANQYCRKKDTHVWWRHSVVTDPSDVPSTAKLVSLSKMNVKLHCKGSEDFRPKANSLDLCFTSPPYFDLEKYSNSNTQSWKKFPTMGLWVNKFMRRTFDNCYHGLKKNRCCLINISDNSKQNVDLVHQVTQVGIAAGFRYEGFWKLPKRKVSGNGVPTAIAFDPILVFRKRK